MILVQKVFLGLAILVAGYVYFFHPVKVTSALQYFPISDQFYYAKDDTTVYYVIKKLGTSTLVGADPATFTPLQGYAKDKNYVYGSPECVGCMVPLLNADLATFVVLGDGFFAKDKNHVYANGGSILQNADPATFKAYVFYGQGGNDDYGVDKSHVYFFEWLMPQADPLTFKVYESPRPCGINKACTAEDKNHKYNQDRVIE